MIQHLLTNDHGEWNALFALWAAACAAWTYGTSWLRLVVSGPPAIEPLSLDEVSTLRLLATLHTRGDGSLVPSRYASMSVTFPSLPLPEYKVSVDVSPETADALSQNLDLLRRALPSGITWQRLAARLYLPGDQGNTEGVDFALRLLALGFIHDLWDVLPRMVGPHYGLWRLWPTLPAPLRRTLTSHGFLFPVWRT